MYKVVVRRQIIKQDGRTDIIPMGLLTKS